VKIGDINEYVRMSISRDEETGVAATRRAFSTVVTQKTVSFEMESDDEEGEGGFCDTEAPPEEFEVVHSFVTFSFLGCGLCMFHTIPEILAEIWGLNLEFLLLRLDFMRLQELSEEQEKIMSMFMASDSGPQRTLADMIMQRIQEKDAGIADAETGLISCCFGHQGVFRL
jgi:hypothetical protein